MRGYEAPSPPRQAAAHGGCEMRPRRRRAGRSGPVGLPRRDSIGLAPILVESHVAVQRPRRAGAAGARPSATRSGLHPLVTLDDHRRASANRPWPAAPSRLMDSNRRQSSAGADRDALAEERLCSDDRPCHQVRRGRRTSAARSSSGGTVLRRRAVASRRRDSAPDWQGFIREGQVVHDGERVETVGAQRRPHPLERSNSSQGDRLAVDVHLGEMPAILALSGWSGPSFAARASRVASWICAIASANRPAR